MHQLNKPFYKKTENEYLLFGHNFSSDSGISKPTNISEYTSVDGSPQQYGTFKALEELQKESRRLFGCDAIKNEKIPI